MPAKPPRTYFAEQLAGEKPLSQRTASRLCRLAAEISALEPWRYMDEMQTVAVVHRKGREPDFVSVLGMLGEFRAIHVYPGFAGYWWMKQVVESSDSWRLRLMLTECEALQAAFPGPGEITDLDMDLLRGCRYPAAQRAFHFRSVRRGYLPWYLCEEEGKRLAACLEAFVRVLSSQVLDDPDKWWPDEPDKMPLVGKFEGQWRVGQVRVPPAGDEERQLWLSEERLAGLRPLKRQGVVCLGDHLMRGAAGLENERPMVLQVMAVVDARSGFAFEPGLRRPGEPLAAVAAEALARASETRGAVPERVLVAEPYYAEQLQPLARAAGFEIQLKRRLPALDALFSSLERFEKRAGKSGSQIV
jgi:hypothetical protein